MILYIIPIWSRWDIDRFWLGLALETTVSEWLMFNAKWAIFQLHHGKNIVDDVCFVLDQHASSIFFMVLAQWNNSQQTDLSLHADTLSWLTLHADTLTRYPDFNATCWHTILTLTLHTDTLSWLTLHADTLSWLTLHADTLSWL
jgi:hypothetical protein